MKTSEQVLTQLIQAAPAPLSGEAIAQKLQLSRTAVWKAVQELKEEGYQIDSIPRKGYLYQDNDHLNSAMIQLALQPQIADFNVRFMPDSASTMNDAKIAAIEGAPSNTLFLANMQEAPRGRFGRPFFALPGGGIYMSLLLHPQRTFQELPLYTVMMAVAVCQAIEELTDRKPLIKWVNDLYLDGKKICGILSEALTDVESGQLTSIVIGMGLNFHIPEATFPEAIRVKAGSLFEDTPPITRNDLIIAIWQNFYRILDGAPYLEAYRQRSFVLGRQVTFQQKGETYTGIAKDILDHGELLVQLSDGSERRLFSGEISLTSIQ
ncbi:biotin-[acetyl-CoA-carboxylase] ligase [Enterococcus canis]|uniref:Bifunctional ligase/repressor BirA n=1 Tax=Enterococcus canis TaxID=214095 RepID=A0A1L8RDJ7_9ENTE|nr:biotin--[acetyl-CoA-carboxylase] ligase [Enterococcus canis]OJG17813.1 biotin-[acetyl-CoA-carboxylase] ligase [Enterococcus canis]